MFSTSRGSCPLPTFRAPPITLSAAKDMPLTHTHLHMGTTHMQEHIHIRMADLSHYTMQHRVVHVVACQFHLAATTLVGGV